jgi:hypothetical protein
MTVPERSHKCSPRLCQPTHARTRALRTARRFPARAPSEHPTRPTRQQRHRSPHRLHRDCRIGLAPAVSSRAWHRWIRPAIQRSTRAVSPPARDPALSNSVAPPGEATVPVEAPTRLLRLLDPGVQQTPHPGRATRSDSHRSPRQTAEFAWLGRCCPTATRWSRRTTSSTAKRFAANGMHKHERAGGSHSQGTGPAQSRKAARPTRTQVGRSSLLQ